MLPARWGQERYTTKGTAHTRNGRKTTTTTTANNFCFVTDADNGARRQITKPPHKIILKKKKKKKCGEGGMKEIGRQFKIVVYCSCIGEEHTIRKIFFFFVRCDLMRV